jgi:transcriptional regulator with XRE-family HTH domain
VTLGQKIRSLRLVEGQLRNLERAMTQLEVVHALHKELGRTISQSYLSQIENGARPHVTHTTRQLLAHFFKVQPSYLVDDPDGFQLELASQLAGAHDTLDSWLAGGAERFRNDAEVRDALQAISEHDQTRKCLVLLHSIIEVPGLIDQLWHALHPTREPGAGPGKTSKRNSSHALPKALPKTFSKKGGKGHDVV